MRSLPHSANPRWLAALPGPGRSGPAGLERQVGLTETHHGSTITLERAFADASRLVLTFTVRRPETASNPRSVGIGHTTVQFTDIGGHTYTLQPTGLGTADYGGDGTTPEVQSLGFDTSVLPARGGSMEAEVTLADLTDWRITSGSPQPEDGTEPRLRLPAPDFGPVHP